MKKLLIAVAVLSLVACTNEDTGTIGGAAIGGLLGSQFGSGGGQVAATAAGMLIGAHIGNRIGATMDKVDRARMSHALETTKTGRATSWRNPDSGIEYSVRPTRTFERQYHGEYQNCREYTTTAIIDRKQRVIHGTACRLPGGGWKVVS